MGNFWAWVLRRLRRIYIHFIARSIAHAAAALSTLRVRMHKIRHKTKQRTVWDGDDDDVTPHRLRSSLARRHASTNAMDAQMPPILDWPSRSAKVPREGKKGNEPGRSE
jgi:hypothetical protein